MSKKFQILIASLSILGLTVFFGCAAFQKVLTPCYVNPASADYANTETTSVLPWTTLWDMERIDIKMDYVHMTNQVKDKMLYEFLKTGNRVSIMASEELQSTIFSPAGPIGLIFPTIFGGTLGALLLKRPGDKSPKEVANGG